MDIWAPANSASAFLPLPAAVGTEMLPAVVARLGWAPPMPNSHRKLLETVLLLRELRRAARDSAARIDGRGYDLAFVHACRHTAAPLVLNYMKAPTAYYGAEPLRGLYEPDLPASSEPRRQGGARRLNGLLVRLLLHRLLGGAELRAARSADLLLANSCYSREVLWRSYGLFARVSYPGVDTTRFCPDAATEPGGYVLSVGRVAPPKGHEFVVEAVGRIPEGRRPSVLVVADVVLGGALDRLAKTARAAGVDLAVRSGVSEEELVSLYRRASLLAYAPIMEPLGLAALEAMACGTPVVGVREAGIRETVEEGETGLLTERDSAEFAEAVDRMLADRGARRRMSENGVAHVRSRWTWKHCVDRLLGHFAQLLHGTKGGT